MRFAPDGEMQAVYSLLCGKPTDAAYVEGEIEI